MKTPCLIAAVALLVASPAVAQWQTPDHSVPVGRGGGATGFRNAAPGVAGKPFVSTGATTDPAFGNVANSGFAPGAANTYKGSLDGTTVADVPMPDCQSVSTAIRYAAGVGPNCGNVLVQTGMDMPINLGLSASAAGGALTINVTQASGGAPTASNPVLVPFRSTTVTVGTTVWRTISSALSLTVPSGATLGTANNTPFRVWLFLDDNGGTPAIGVATCSIPTAIFPCSSWESTLKTSVTISATASTGGVLYAGAGVTLDAVRIIGYCEFSSGLATAGTWASACTALQVFGPGIKKPGDVVQTVLAVTSATLGIATTPGTQILSQTITPTSKASLFDVQGTVAVNGSASTASVFLTRAGTQFPVGSQFPINVNAAFNVPVTLVGIDFPASASAVTYSIWGVTSAGSNTAGGGQIIKISEIQP